MGSTPAEGTNSTFHSNACTLAEEPGRYLTANPSGNKRWRLKFRIGGQEKLSAIGIYPDVTLNMESSKDKFLTLLYNDLLKVDLADLDFGFYRILKYRREEVKAFFGQRLPQILAEAMRGQTADRATQVRNRLKSLTDSLETAAPTRGLAGAFTDGRLDEHLAALPAGRDYLALIEEQALLEAAAGFTQSEEERLYNHLYLFFSRYYADGDFVSQPRRGRDGRYSVAYNGEDVHFHWRGRGGHYVKTTEELRSYRYRDGDWSVEFALAEATEEQSNVKGKTRYFFPLPDRFEVDPATRSARLPFVFRPLNSKEETQWKGNGPIQDQIVELAVPQLRKRLKPGLDGDRLAHHVRRYTRKHRIDYFVHPALGAFLKSELDWYLKNELLDVEAFTDPEGMTEKFIKFHALRKIGGLIIDFLDQVETFQAALFEKRKFVLRTDYLAPVRMLDPALWPEIVKCPAQIAAWRDLFGLKGRITVETLKAQPMLVVDTRHFDDGFKLRLLACYPDIDEALDGVLVHAENYAALRTLEYRYRGQVKCIYIDPPYNTGSDDFLYKDDFSKHSTWLVMMEERLNGAKQLFDKVGSLLVSIDDVEQSYLRALLDDVFGASNFLAQLTWEKTRKNDAKLFSVGHDYVLVYSRDKDRLLESGAIWREEKPGARAIIAKYREIRANVGANNDDTERLLREWYRSLPKDHPSKKLSRYKQVDDYGPWRDRDISWPGGGGPRYDLLHPVTHLPCKIPERGWIFGPEEMQRQIALGLVVFREDHTMPPFRKAHLVPIPGEQDYLDAEEDTEEFGLQVMPSVIYKQSQVSVKLLRDLLGSKAFQNPKDHEVISRLIKYTTGNARGVVLDFFAGSGTTGHAVIAMNRSFGTNARFVLVEQGAHFEPVLVRRIQRTIYSEKWKDGRPLPESTGDDWISHSPRLEPV